MKDLPIHLQKYIVDQNYKRYTPVDQAVWRYVLRQLKRFLSTHAHESYLTGLSATGIETEQIPSIEQISKRLEHFGWRALPVSGFIPPAAFMELQSLSVLPIACDMRSMDHLLYTPAPDIVHEAAGHAPILAYRPYADYLKKYALVAKKAIVSKDDLAVYEAIRELSDIKENPQSTPEQIARSGEKLKKATKSISHTSEASQLSRMNWWTAEYGLIGDINSPKIFGAGLLSSVGESKWCLSDKVKKIPLTIDCIKQTYDITEPQPQLFVAKDFDHLSQVLEDLAKTMAFQTGGSSALNKLKLSSVVNTVELDSGLQISGVLKDFSIDSKNEPYYLQFDGPSQICYKDHELDGHSNQYHSQGYGTPLGEIVSHNINELKKLIGQMIEVEYASGVIISGLLKKVSSVTDKAAVITFGNAICQKSQKVFFLPEWGDFDVCTGLKVVSCYAGPADRASFGETDDFVAAVVPSHTKTKAQEKLYSHYQKVRSFRQSQRAQETDFQELFLQLSRECPNEWLLFVELSEISYQNEYNQNFRKMIVFHLEKIKEEHPELTQLINDGLELVNKSL